MATTQTWIAGRVGQWFDTANWTSGTVPSVGDTVIIPSGMPEIDGQTIGGEQITLGGSSSSSIVTLVANSATFEPLVTPGPTVVEQSLTVTGGNPSNPMTATLLSSGTTSYEGQIFVEPVRGTFTIDAGTNGNFIFTNSLGGTFVLVSQESALHFQGAQITTAGVIEIEGSADIAASVADFGGSGIVALDRGGQLSVEGAVSPGQHVYFADGTGKVTIANASAFQGTLGFTPYAGDRIDLTAVQAQSYSVDRSTGVLRLFSGGIPVAQLNVETIDPVTFTPTHLPLTNDFTIGSDGAGGTLITYTPQGPTYLEASMAVPVVATAGTKVPLQSILSQSFGTTTPTPYGITLMLPTESESTPTDQKFWVNPPAKGTNPAWYVNGSPITQDYTVQPGDTVELFVGDNIAFPAQIRLQVTRSGMGTSAEFVTYDVWTVDPQVAALVQASGAQPGHPTTADIITSAQSWNTIFPNIPNTNLCDWIADDVGAAAGAAMPEPNQLYDPSLNVSGGFWRIVYTGSSLQNWSPLVQPGDVVRMQWFKQSSPLDISGHTTTVLGIGGPGGSITVYDNVNFVNGKETIGIHSATYWTATNPQSITIYRLDPNQQYLIQGTSLSEVIQGSVYNNLIQPGGGADVITAGFGINEIQDTTVHLNGITVTDFHFGDELDFIDLNPAQFTIAYTGTLLLVFSNNAQVAAIALPGLPSTDSFVVTPDGNGGSLIALNPPGPNPPPPAGTTADMILRNGSYGLYEIYNIGNNAILAAYSLGQVGTTWVFVTLGGFHGSDTTDMLLHNTASGAFEVYNIIDNSIASAASLGAVGLNWQVAGFGNFSSNPGETDMLLRNTGTGAFQVYDISNNTVTSTANLGTVGIDWQVAGFGNFSSNPGETDMLLCNTGTGAFQVYDISNNTVTSTTNLGTVGIDWQVAGLADFSSNPGETDMLLRNTGTGAFQVYDISNNSVSATANLGTVGLNWQVAGFGNFSSNPGETDMLLRDAVTGAFEVYDIANNQITGAAFLGIVGLDWQVAGFAPLNGAGSSDMVLRNVNTGAFEVYNIANNQITGAALLGTVGLNWQLGAFAVDPPTASTAAAGNSGQVGQLVQAMASFGGGSGAADGLSTVVLGADTSQQSFLTTPQHG
jgi:hypothetical protein